jgi:hypothetical protein
VIPLKSQLSKSQQVNINNTSKISTTNSITKTTILKRTPSLNKKPTTASNLIDKELKRNNSTNSFTSSLTRNTKKLSNKNLIGGKIINNSNTGNIGNNQNSLDLSRSKIIGHNTTRHTNIPIFKNTLSISANSNTNNINNINKINNISNNNKNVNKSLSPSPQKNEKTDTEENLKKINPVSARNNVNYLNFRKDQREKQQVKNTSKEKFNSLANNKIESKIYIYLLMSSRRNFDQK